MFYPGWGHAGPTTPENLLCGRKETMRQFAGQYASISPCHAVMSSLAWHDGQPMTTTCHARDDNMSCQGRLQWWGDCRGDILSYCVRQIDACIALWYASFPFVGVTWCHAGTTSCPAMGNLMSCQGRHKVMSGITSHHARDDIRTTSCHYWDGIMSCQG